MNHLIAEHPDGGVFCLHCNVTASSYGELLPYECPTLGDLAKMEKERQTLADETAILIAARERIEKEHAEERSRK